MIFATDLSLNNNEDDTWFFVDTNNNLISPTNSQAKNNFYKYYNYMKDNNYFIKIYKIPTYAMSKTIKKDDYILTFINKNYIPKRNDLIAFKYKKNNRETIYLKRCVAIAGDIIFEKDKNIFLHPYEGNVFVTNQYKGYETIILNNNLYIKNPYKLKNKGIHHDPNVLKSASMSPIELFDFKPIQIPKDEYFMLGDNRDHSNDSRFLGTIKRRNILGYSIILKFKNDEKIIKSKPNINEIRKTTLTRESEIKNKIAYQENIIKRYKNTHQNNELKKLFNAYIYKGLLLGQLEQHEKALKEYQIIIDKFKNNKNKLFIAMAMNNKAATLNILNKPDLALKVLEKLIHKFKYNKSHELINIIESAKSLKNKILKNKKIHLSE